MSTKSSRTIAAAWAKQAAPRPSNVCQICADPEAAEAIAEILRLRREGKSRVSIRQTVAFLRDELKRPHCESTIQNHCTNHLGIRWGALGEASIAAQEKARAAKRR